jgi:chromate transporter
MSNSCAPMDCNSTIVGGGFGGAIVMTVGMFLPAFSFTLIGHNLMEKAISIKLLTSFFDGVTAGVVGLIAITAVELTKAAVVEVYGALLFVMSLAALYYFKHRMTVIVIILASAASGQVLYMDD